MGSYVRVHSNCPSLEAGVRVSIAFEYFERNVLFSQALGQAEPANTGSDDQDVHRDAARIYNCAGYGRFARRGWLWLQVLKLYASTSCRSFEQTEMAIKVRYSSNC
jgi:hypothetical protein